MSTTSGAFWMPFTANRHFRQRPRMLVAAEGMFYRSDDGRRILDGTAGLWCVNAGHARAEITAAVHRQLTTLDFAPTFQMGHPFAVELAERLTRIAPPGLDRAFFANSGSEAVDTALKIALAYHQRRGDTERTVLIGRERAYHGVGFGGMSVGGIAKNREIWQHSLLPHIDHLRHTHDPARNAFTRGQPDHGAEFADDLERLVAKHGAGHIAAVIVEPVAGSTGVLVPPQGYLERLRALCDRHGLLLIFDEVISGFGRTGSMFAAQRFGVRADLLTCAKGLTNGAVPMGAVLLGSTILDAFMQGPLPDIDLFHGYTYSGHPVACAAALAALAIYEDEGLAQRAAQLAPSLADAAHALRGLPGVIDVRNCGLMAAIELADEPVRAPTRAFDVFTRCFEHGLLVRATGNVIALSPPLIVTEPQIAQMFATLAAAIRATR